MSRSQVLNELIILTYFVIFSIFQTRICARTEIKAGLNKTQKVIFFQHLSEAPRRFTKTDVILSVGVCVHGWNV